MNFQLSEEQEILINSVKSFVQKELLPHEEEVDRQDNVSSELTANIRRKAQDAGLYAFNIPKEGGGPGLDFVSQALIERELSKCSWALHVNVGRPSNVLMACKGDQIDEYLKPCVTGAKIDCFALTEPGAGSDANAINTKAKKNGDDFVLNGSKHFISHAGYADFIIVFAVTGSYKHKNRSRNEVTAFLIDSDTKGLTVRRGPKCVSNRGYHTFELFFDECRVSSKKVLGEVAKGWDIANEWLTAGRVMVAANCVGQAQRALEASLSWSADRNQFGKPIAMNQGISFKLADMATEIRAADLITLYTAQKMNLGTMTDADAGMAKLFSSEVLGRVVDEAVQIYGGMGLMDEAPIERMWRNARIERIWEGTSEIQRHIISRELLAPYLKR